MLRRRALSAIRSASKGFLIAWDPANAREAWRVEHKGPWNGGTLATAGGLVFEGTVDGRFLALDARTGKELWAADHRVSTLAGPITYSVNGEQYVAALSGFGSVFNLTSAAISPIQPSRVNGRVHVYKIGVSEAYRNSRMWDRELWDRPYRERSIAIWSLISRPDSR